MLLEEFVKKEGYKVLYVLGYPIQAERIIKKVDRIEGYIGDKVAWYFPNIDNMDDYVLEEGQEWDLSDEDIRDIHDLDVEFRLSILELGV